MALRRVAVGRHAGRERLVLRVEDLLLLLAHRAAQQVGLAERVAGDLLRGRHHLLLVDDQAVRGPEDLGEGLLELRVDRRDLLAAVLAQGVVRVAVDAHRTGAVEREDGRDVLEVVRAHQPQQRPHRPAVELEHPERVAVAQQRVRRRVVERQVLEDEVDAAVEHDVLDRVVEHGEVAEPEEVHLDQAERLAGRVVELGDDRAVLLPAHDRDDVDERLAAHDHAGRVHAPLALQALEVTGGVDDLHHVGVGLVERPELAALAVAGVLAVEQLAQRDVLAHHGRRHGLGQPLPHPEGVAEHPGRVLDRLLRLDRAVGDDLADAVLAVLLRDVADDLAAPALVEVDVEVGHRDAVRVEEPLEDQAVLERVEVGDPHGVRGHRPGARPAARADPDPVLLGPVDEVGDDEEIAGEAHLRDDAGLELGLPAHLVGDAGRVAPAQPRLHLFDEPGGLVLSRRAREARHVGAGALGEGDVAALGDRERVVAGVGQLGEQRPHLGRRLEVVAVAVELEAVGVGHRGAGLHAEQDLVGRRFGARRVVQVVGGDQREVEVLGQPQQVLADAALDGQAVVHQLHEVAVGPEDVAELGRAGDRLVVLAQPQVGLDLPRRAAGRGDEPLAVGVEQLAVHPRLEVVALERGERAHPEQVVQPGGALGPHRHVGERAAARDVVAVRRGLRVAPADPLALAAVGLGRGVRLEPHDRLDARALGRLVELVGAEQVAVVGHRDGRHALLLAPGEEVGDPGGTVEHGVLGVHVQVHEAVARGGARPGRCGAGAHRRATLSASSERPRNDAPDPP